MSKKNSGYKIDFIYEVIVVTRKYHRLVTTGDSKESISFRKLINELPDYAVVFSSRRKRKCDSAKLTYTKMIEYICRQEDSENALREFNAVRNPIESVSHAPYQYVKKWFMTKYPNYNKMTEFDDKGNVISTRKAAVKQNDKLQEAA